MTFQNYSGVEYYSTLSNTNKQPGEQLTPVFTKVSTSFASNDTLLNIHGDFYNFYFHQFLKVANYRVSKAIENGRNQIFFHNRNTVFKKSLSNEKVEQVKIPYDIESFYLDGQENLWICTRKGLFFFKDSNLNIEPKVYFDDLLISCIKEDFQGNFWIGTNDSGVKFVPSFEISIVDHPKLANKNESFLSINVNNEFISFGSSKSKIIVCDATEECRSYAVPAISSNNQINKIYPWKDNSVILNSGTVFSVEETGQPKYSSNKYGYTVLCSKLKNGDLVVFARSALFGIEKADGLITSENFTNPINSNLYVVAQNLEKDIFFGTAQGLFLVKDYDYNNNSEILDIHGEGLGRVSDIVIENNGIIWVSTIGNGVYAVKETTAIKFDEVDRFSSPMVNNLISTNDSLLWLATNNGIDVLSYNIGDTLSTKYLRRINNTDGLVSTNVNDIEYWNGKIWAATNRGVCNFHPNILDKEVPQIPISITRFVNRDSTYNIEDELHFEHDQNDVFIAYSGLSFQQFNEQVEYKYKLIKDGNVKKEKWIYTKDRSVRFNDLPHGDYTFEVNAMNKLRNWNESSASVSFVIKPHFTETLLFKALALLSLVIGIYTIIRIQNNRDKAKQLQLLELEEAKRNMQEAEISAIRNQMNPHFVYNSLNSIQNLFFKNDSYGANYYLSKFSLLLRQSLQFTSVNFITLKQEFDFLSNYIELESLRFPNKFAYKTKIDDSINMDLILIPSLILQPIVENSIKHGFDDIDYSGEIIIEVVKKEQTLEISISDNGKGVTKTKKSNSNNSQLHKSFGIKMVNNRLDLLNQSHFDGQATAKMIQSEKGYQTLFVLPIIYDND